jgi:hypothetical protein
MATLRPSDISGLVQATAERRQRQWPEGSSGPAFHHIDNADQWERRLLRERRQRPSHGQTKPRNKFAPSDQQKISAAFDRRKPTHCQDYHNFSAQRV